MIEFYRKLKMNEQSWRIKTMISSPFLSAARTAIGAGVWVNWRSLVRNVSFQSSASAACPSLNRNKVTQNPAIQTRSENRSSYFEKREKVTYTHLMGYFPRIEKDWLIFPRDRKVEGNINTELFGWGKYSTHFLVMVFCDGIKKKSKREGGQ